MKRLFLSTALVGLVLMTANSFAQRPLTLIWVACYVPQPGSFFPRLIWKESTYSLDVADNLALACEQQGGTAYVDLGD